MPMWEDSPPKCHIIPYHLIILLTLFQLTLWTRQILQPSVLVSDYLKPSVISSVLCALFLLCTCVQIVMHPLLWKMLCHKCISVHILHYPHMGKGANLIPFIITVHDKLPKMHIEWSEYTHFELLICTALIFPGNHNSSCCLFSS